MLHSEAQVLNEAARSIELLPPPLKKSLLSALTIFSRLNKRLLQVPDSRLDMIKSIIRKNDM